MAPTTTGAVVDARFCAPHATAFTVSKKSERNMSITDDADGGAAVMRVEGQAWCWPRRSLLLDAASCQTVVTVKRCPSLLPVTRRGEAFRGGSASPAELLFATVSQPWVFSRGVVHVHLAGGGNRRYSERRVDYVVVCGGRDGRECTVSLGRANGPAVAKINRTTGPLDEQPEYNVSVNPGVDRAFVLALTVILDEIRVDESWRHRN
uniref:Uncharacterized protein n=1 Tax=Aegilops tauschii TaxID=37682 RepID=M8B5P9_AEGTA